MSVLERRKKANLVRSFVFGVEDSLVSTVGLVAGIAIAGVPRGTILLTGAVLIFVEALSMAIGDFLSESSAEEYLEQREVSAKGPIQNGVVMFFSYLIFGMIPLLPYLLLESPTAFWVSVGATLATLFLLGITSAGILRLRVLRHGMSMLILGGLAVLIGVLVGKVVNIS